MLELLGNHSESERPHAGDGFVSIPAVRHHARKGRYFGEPATVGFALDFNRECHLAMYHSGRLLNKAPHPTPPASLARTSGRE